mmetsp:Transcript_10990/g.15288  ORF Transcript_10990/g.15288 Transcript_10990/m.15288 type:complete len:180 (-) Transcript_10990:303-842(-)|eukprot:CAMPEP_0184488212 /NCGR_PEP_ID=MMETSP0113_2-20130426/10595_1 /TAXON_ID=91329 /ORGANISM="Norrisiella sphaerica, Strain BC52" /LENGTH=179 /DNA_ID=CAMNT_0026870717 /DNA_START=115 /DNA_END=654 /DNA_ORIENTATION=+
MGSSLSNFWHRLFGNRQVRVVMIGLDAAGKTTVLYKLKLGEVITTVPTIGFNVETLEVNRLELQVWDIGGQDKIRPLWQHYYENTDGIIFVIDCNDRERINLAKRELKRTLDEPLLKDAPLLVYANKQDLSRSLTPGELVSCLDLNKMGYRRWHVQGSCAINGSGLFEGIEWLAKIMNK